ncbi:unnamed protein product [Sphagnum jensenii]|uniref:Uncharacterized protein n=1 Tax=Sphagnum jensenii TaxID=128206 RepID=A0ABP1A1Z9_9BRYO
MSRLGSMIEKTLELFQQMQPEEMIADGFTFVQLLDACVSLRALEDGRYIHMQIIEWSFWPRPEGTGIISSNAAARGDPVTFVGVLIACARVAALEDRRHVHEEII